jgi:hypothetical protein
VAYAANAAFSPLCRVVPKVWVTGSSSFDVLFSLMLRGISPGSPVSSLGSVKINM